MLRLHGVVSTALLVLGLSGFALTLLTPRLPAAVVEPVAAVLDAGMAAAGVPEQQPRAAAAADVEPSAAITRLVIPSIGLDTRVTMAPLVQHDGATTWDIPKFIAGHAEGSAGAGQPGNAIVLGHVTSLTLGNVFEHLDRVTEGDGITVFSDDRSYEYRATHVGNVERTAVDVLDPTPDPTLTLITCSGWWLPTVGDYNERFVVKANAVT